MWPESRLRARYMSASPNFGGRTSPCAFRSVLCLEQGKSRRPVTSVLNIPSRSNFALLAFLISAHMRGRPSLL